MCDKQDCETVCLGEIIEKICQIHNCFCLLKLVINKHVQKFEDIVDELKDYDYDDNLPSKYYDLYFSIAYHLRKEINGLLHRCIDSDLKCIPSVDQALILHFCNEDICFIVSSFLALKYLQKTNDCCDLLFYSEKPSNSSCKNNKKVTLNKVDGNAIYPCWFYTHNGKISCDYTEMSQIVGGNIDYACLNEYRLLLNGDIEEDCRKTVEAYGKYKFRYNRDDAKKTLPDPNNPDEKISPHIQGVIGGAYSFADNLDCIGHAGPARITVSNTVCVLKYLVEFICNFIKDVDELKLKLVTEFGKDCGDCK